MPAYEFTTVWKTEAPIEQVWERIYHSERWPKWWRGVLSVEELKEGDDLGVGSIKRYAWRGILPYTLVFDVETVEVLPHKKIVGNALGDLEGRGVFTLNDDNGVVIMRYDWGVDTNKNWMNLMAPLARPLFKWNHDVIMRSGAEGLSKVLDRDVFEL